MEAVLVVQPIKNETRSVFSACADGHVQVHHGRGLAGL